MKNKNQLQEDISVFEKLLQEAREPETDDEEWALQQLNKQLGIKRQQLTGNKPPMNLTTLSRHDFLVTPDENRASSNSFR